MIFNFRGDDRVNKKKEVSDILSKYDKNTNILYSYIAALERDTKHRVKRQEVREKIKLNIEKVVGNENK